MRIKQFISIMRLTFQCPIDPEGRAPELIFDPGGTGTSNFCPSSIPPMGTVTVMACPFACASNVYPCSNKIEGNNMITDILIATSTKDDSTVQTHLRQSSRRYNLQIGPGFRSIRRTDCLRLFTRKE